MNYRQLIIDNKLFALFQQGTFGLEKEGQRVNSNGDIVTTPHPQQFGSRTYHPYIQTDFAETQLELITPATTSEKEALRWLEAIHEVTLKQLDNEWMYAASMPAQLPEQSDILESQMGEEDTLYRQKLTEKYGKYKQMVSGIHYNFGFSTDFLNALRQGNDTLVDVRNNVYIRVARQFIRYQWLLIYLFGSSITVDKKYFHNTKEVPNHFVRSIRASHLGYVNDKSIQVSYQSLEEYVKTLRHYVDTNQLIAEKEFYSSVRFRGAKSIAQLLHDGVQYIELRLFDINPFLVTGIDYKMARFIHLFVMLMLWLDEEDNAVTIGKEYSNVTALENPLSQPTFEAEGQWLFTQLLHMLDTCRMSEDDYDIVQFFQKQLDNPKDTIGGQLALAYEQSSQKEVDMYYTKKHKATLLERPYGIQAFSNMELSTQALIEDAIIMGVSLDILDESDQFLKLSYNSHEEYVKNGNMTRLDTYISPLIMENKVVTKKVLSKAGFNVPNSIQVTSVKEALSYYSLVKEKPIVIKPKSTNYGLGITIFKEAPIQKEDFETAVSLALKEDSEVMIEDFIFGTEYRFFVLNDTCEAVLLRVGANVIGDGYSTIEQLVNQKNNNKLRGDGSKTPLKKIKLGDIEQLQLKEQGLTIHSVLKNGQQVYLRANSNISTGGDSIDVSDDVHPSYKDIAVGITKEMFAKVCGVDLIIPDITLPASDNANSYGVVEANFNPMMMMHIYPSVGQSRRLTKKVIELLFPELKTKH